MIEIDFQLSNEGARSLAAEMQAFLRHAANKMARQGNNEDATRSYAILRSFEKKLSVEITAQDKRFEEEKRKKKNAARPTVRDKYNRKEDDS